MTLQQRKILIYGNSILLEGASHALRASSHLRVILLKPALELTALVEHRPDLIVIDAAQFTPNQQERLLAAFPADHSPMIIRLDLQEQRLTVISSRQFPAVNLEDLRRILENLMDPDIA